MIILTSGITCYLSEIYIYTASRVIHFIIGAILFVVVVLSIIIKEDYVLIFIKEKVLNLLGKNEPKKDE